MSHHRRRSGLTLEQRVYRWMKARQDVTARQVSEGIGIGYWAAVQAIMRLCSKGCAAKKGSTYTRVYNATEVAPEDMRGTAMASLDQLRPMMQKPKRTVPKPKPAIALEEAWPLLPFPQVAEDEATF